MTTMHARVTFPLAMFLLAAAHVNGNALHDAAVAGDVVWLKRLLDSRQFDIESKDSNGSTPLAAALARCSGYGEHRNDTICSASKQELGLYCEPASMSAVAAALVCAGADVDVDVCPKQHPGYKLAQHAACGGSDGLIYLLAAGAKGVGASTTFQLPNGSQQASLLEWAVMCLARRLTASLVNPDIHISEYGSSGSSFSILLQSGADPLPNGRDRPLSALVFNDSSVFPLAKCNTLGACTETEVQSFFESNVSSLPDFVEYVSGYWRVLWEAQENSLGRAARLEQTPEWLTQGRSFACKASQDYYNTELKARDEQKRRQRYAEAYPLHAAAAASNLTAVQQLIKSGRASVNDRDDKGLTPLQVGMQRHPDVDAWSPGFPQINETVAAYLISNGAKAQLDVYPNSSPGYTLLHKAASHGLKSLVKVLLSGGADPNAVFYDNYTGPDGKNFSIPVTPLISAVRCDGRHSMMEGPGPDSNNSTVEALLDAGADPLLFGRDRPVTGNFTVPPEAKKCVQVGACSEAEVMNVLQYFQDDSCPASFLLVWKAQEA